MMLKYKGRKIDGFIQHSACHNCGCEVFNFIFSGDTDMATSGLVALIKPGSKFIAITEATPAEWNNYQLAEIAKRVNVLLNTTGFIVLEHEHFPDKNGTKVWQSKCPKCGQGQTKLEDITINKFLNQGGKYYLV